MEKHELYCHNCGRYVQFEMDLSIDDRYDIVCPACGHHHYRVVENGKITETRWGRDASQQQITSNWGSSYTTISTGTSTYYSTYTTYSTALTDTSGAGYYSYTAWMNTTITT